MLPPQVIKQRGESHGAAERHAEREARTEVRHARRERLRLREAERQAQQHRESSGEARKEIPENLVTIVQSGASFEKEKEKISALYMQLHPDLI